MKIYASPATRPGETRTPLTDASAKSLAALGAVVHAPHTLGAQAGISADSLQAAEVQNTEPAQGWAEADIVLTLDAPQIENIQKMKPGAVLIGLLDPVNQPDLIRACVDQNITVMAMEFVPRISRAQAADALSSQASIGGYKAALMAADHCPKLLPMMMTAAGTLSPARVFVIGAGVAGLQAIATAKRLGAIVEAFDVRTATKEQVQSLGARFIEIRLDTDGDAAGGYAKELTDEQRQKQTELMAKHVTEADIVITTAAVFGRKPPMLIPADVVQKMKPGAVLVDMGASEAHQAGNCESTAPGSVLTTDNSVTIIGTTHLPGLVPVHASQAYANNLVALVREFVKDGQMTLDLEDEVVGGATIVHDGAIQNDIIKNTIGAG